MLISSINQVSQQTSNGVKCVIYGDSGIGKTMLTATAPRPLLLSAEGGELSLSVANRKRVFGDNTECLQDFPVVTMPRIGNKPTKAEIDAPLNTMREVYSYLVTNKDGIQTLVIDSLSEIAEIILSSLKANVRDARQAYGELSEKITSIIRLLNELPINIVYICKASKLTDTSGGVCGLTPSMPGKNLGSTLPYLMDEIFYYKTIKQDNQTYRVLCTQPDSDYCQYQAKDRSGALAVFESPNLTTIFNKIKGN